MTLTLLAAASSGFEVVPAKGLDQLVNRLNGLSAPAVLHLHWTHPICQPAENADEAVQSFTRFSEAVEQFKDRGGRVVWTVHNTQPHELRWPEHERSLVTFLASIVDRIHVMNPATAELMREWVKLPADRIRLVPHPSYAGIYPATRAREELRRELGFTESDRVVALIGELRGYKGVRTLLEALAVVAETSDDPPALLLAGKVPDDEMVGLEASLPAGIRSVFHPGFIPSAELGNWFGVADLCVLPYERILNSGSAHMAATAGVPVALPNVSSLVQVFDDEPWVHFFDHTSPVESLAALIDDRSTYERHDECAADFSRARSPWRISQRMCDELYGGVREGESSAILT